MECSFCLYFAMLFLSVEGGRYYDDEEVKTLSEMIDQFISSSPYFLSGVLFFLVSIWGMKGSYCKKWLQEKGRIKKCLIVLWWIAAILGGICVLADGLLLVQIVWTCLFEFVLDPIVSCIYWIFRWALFIVGLLLVGIGLPLLAFTKLRDRISGKLFLFLWIVVSAFLMYILVLFSIEYGKELHLFPT